MTHREVSNRQDTQKGAGAGERERATVSFIHSANANCPTSARLFLGTRETALGRTHSFPQGAYILEQEDQQVSKPGRGVETRGEVG